MPVKLNFRDGSRELTAYVNPDVNPEDLEGPRLIEKNEIEVTVSDTGKPVEITDTVLEKVQAALNKHDIDTNEIAEEIGL